MNAIVTTSSLTPTVPAPRGVSIATRPATNADLAFLDQLQKQHSTALGFFPRAQMEGYVANQWVLIAEDAATKQPLGYCASRDRYLKRDELGIIYQLCVAPGDQRKLVGASLIKDVFERSAYGCRLYCCWCAQDLDANYFWESLGFVPIAFRGGSGKKKRIHIFWQRRTREGDTTTPWWFPAKTDQGAMREDRLVLPIPPGLHWSDPMPVMVANTDEGEGMRDEKARRSRSSLIPHPSPLRNGPLMPTPSPRARVQFGRPGAIMPVVANPNPAAPVSTAAVKDKPRRAKEKCDPKLIAAARELRDRYLERVNAEPRRAKEKCDPKLIAAARELRDRYLERVNAEPLALPAPAGKYDVSRSLGSTEPNQKPASPLPAAA